VSRRVSTGSGLPTSTGFGTLMDASHGSLRTDFLMSSAELDELTAIAREGGRWAPASRAPGSAAASWRSWIATASGRSSRRSLEEYYEPRKLTDGIDARVFVAVASRSISRRCRVDTLG
jgi:hypothetical protein